MAKKKADPDAADQPVGGQKVSKADAVRAALAAGMDKPQEGVAYIKGQFGLDLSTQMFSSYKSQEAKRAGQGRRRGRPARVIAGNGKSETNGHGPAGLATQIQAIKTLVDKLGADQVIGIARLFEK